MIKDSDTYDDYELRINFTQRQNVLNFARSEYPICTVSKYRYFEVEVLENKANSQIYVGIIDKDDPF